MHQNNTVFKKSSYLVFSFAYSLFIIYGSLVPLEYRALPFEEALYNFKNIQYLNLGAGSRADWVANIVLYIPLGFSLSGYFLYVTQSYFKIASMSIGILISSMTLAISLEFIQLYFPPRTVSQNDLIAETLGSIIGIVLWVGFGKKLQSLIVNILGGGRSAFIAIGILYALVYLALSFFPYDFVTSFSELEEKFVNGKDAFFISSNCGGLIFCTLKFATEIILVLPLAFLLIVLLRSHSQRQTLIVLIGLVLGVVIEGIQVFIISGIAQGFSIFSRVLGMLTGLFLYKKRSLLKDCFNNINLKKYLIIIFFPYVVLLAKLNGWSLFVPELDSNVVDRFEQIKWLPFYYHYFTSEAVALVSLLYNCIFYLPVGLALWLWNIDNPNHILNIFADRFRAGLYAFSLCLIMETGKLFYSLKHPDPTNLLISFVAAYCCCLLAEIMTGWFKESTAVINTQSNDFRSSVSKRTDFNANFQNNRSQFQYREETQVTQVMRVKEANVSIQLNQGNHLNKQIQGTASLNVGRAGIANNPTQPDSYYEQFPETSSNLFAKTIGLILISIVFWKTIDYPGSSIGLALLLLIYGIILAKYPQSWLIAIPAFLPIFDFAPWTGRFFFSEFDIVVLFTLAINIGYGRILNPFKCFKILASLLLLIFALTYVISLFNGLLPFQTIDENAFSNYYSYYNSLRVGKGVFWAFLLLPSLSFFYHYSATQTKTLFAYGVLLGLIAVSLDSIWERIIFSGLFNFTNNYRITSMFSSMHTGGGHIDSFLVTAIPFVAMIFVSIKKSYIRNLMGIGLFLMSLYVLIVTFSRGPYIALFIQFFVFGLCLVLIYQQQILFNWKKISVISLMVLMIPMVAIPLLKGSIIQQRFSKVSKDFDIRMKNWTGALQMMPSDLSTKLTGMGIGTYPRAYFLGNVADIVPATYAFLNENKSSFLRIKGGNSMYFEQIVETSAYSKYLLSIDFRSNLPDPSLTIPICEKALLYAFNCETQRFQKKSKQNQWVHVERVVDMKSIGAETGKMLGSLTKRPIKFSIYIGNKDAVIDIKNISLLDISNNNLLTNGDFSDGLDHWFFSIDNHLPWHIENIWVQTLFDQGWLGIIAFIGLLTYAYVHQFKRLFQKDYYASILITSITGFMVVGMVASPFNAPRLALLFFLVLFMAFFDQSKNQTYNNDRARNIIRN